jgi:hypothetical protein
VKIYNLSLVNVKFEFEIPKSSVLQEPTVRNNALQAPSLVSCLVTNLDGRRSISCHKSMSHWEFLNATLSSWEIFQEVSY